MKRKREMEKGSEIRCAIEELSSTTTHHVVVVKVKDDVGVGDVHVHHDLDASLAYIPTKSFLFVFNLFIQILDKIGPTMAVLRHDIDKNIQRLEKVIESNPPLYSNLVEILKKEIDEGNAKKSFSCCRAVFWLTRSMEFTVTLLQLLMKDFDVSMEKAVEESYNSTLKPWHGWISSAAYKVAIKLVPDNKTFIDILIAKDQDYDMLKKEMQSLISLLVPLLEQINSVLISYGLDKLKSA